MFRVHTLLQKQFYFDAAGGSHEQQQQAELMCDLDFTVCTDYSVVDDCSQSSLVPSQAVQVEGETLEQGLVTHLQQPRPERVVCNKQHTHNVTLVTTSRGGERGAESAQVYRCSGGCAWQCSSAAV